MQIMVDRNEINGFHNSLAPLPSTSTVLDENARNCLPLSDNNVSTTNDVLMERNWEIPCETDDINVSIVYTLRELVFIASFIFS